MTKEQIQELENRLTFVKQKHAEIKLKYDQYSSMIIEIEQAINKEKQLNK